MILKILQMFVYFIKEVLFERKEEADFKHPNFNPRKYVFVILLVGMFTSNYYLFYGKYEEDKVNKFLREDNKNVVELRDEITKLKLQIENDELKRAELNNYILKKQLLIEKLKTICGKNCDGIY